MRSSKWQKIAITVFWLAVVFACVMSLLPTPPALPGNPSDKVEHVLAFATLTGLSFLAYSDTGIVRRFTSLALFGAAIEIAQSIPALHRDAEFADWIADCLAVLVVVGLCLLIVQGRRSGTMPSGEQALRAQNGEPSRAEINLPRDP